MGLVYYILIIVATATQSAVCKRYSHMGGDVKIFNTLKAGVAACLLAIIAIPNFTWHLPTVIYGLIYGVLITISMYVGYMALSLGPMALTSMLTSFSVLLPLVWGVTMGQEKMSVMQGVAVILLLAAILLTNGDKLRAKQEKKTKYGLWLLFVAATFFSYGVSSILQKVYQINYPDGRSQDFMFYSMALCAIVYMILSLVKTPLREWKHNKGNWWGALAGVATMIVNLFTLLLAGEENASLLYPAVSGGTLLASLLCGKLIFKEKLKINHYIALILGLAAVVLLKL